MQRLRKYNLKLQLDKCEFLRKEVYIENISRTYNNQRRNAQI